jgi:hypothetical protein
MRIKANPFIPAHRAAKKQKNSDLRKYSAADARPQIRYRLPYRYHLCKPRPFTPPRSASAAPVVPFVPT